MNRWAFFCRPAKRDRAHRNSPTFANGRQIWATRREAREMKQMLFPITIAPFEEVKRWKKFDADRGTDSAREIREYYIPDFSGWERDAAGYQREFEKLVGALRNSGQ